MSDYKKADLSTYPPILRNFANYKLDLEDCSQNTIFDYLMDLGMFFRYTSMTRRNQTDYSLIGEEPLDDVDLSFVDSVTPAEVRNFISYANSTRGNKSAARARKLSSIKSFYRYLNSTYQTEYNPTGNIQTPKRTKSLPKFLTLAESIKLLDCVKNDADSKTMDRDYAIITLFLNCGMRLSELVHIDLHDVNPEFESLRVIGKGSKERIIYLNDACRSALVAYLHERNGHLAEIKDKNALFISSRFQRISQKTVQWMVYKYLDMAGLGNRKLSVHKLRHTAATLMYQNGHIDVRVLKDILGHEQLNTTQIYTHVSDEQMRHAIESNPLAAVAAPEKPDILRETAKPNTTDKPSENKR